MADSGRISGDAWEQGSGTIPLLLLHGLGGTWHIWKPVLKWLPDRFRVLAPTLPGHAGGPPLLPGATLSVDAIADALVADLKARGIERCHVAGNSLGGWLSLELARRGVALSVTALSPAGGWQTDKDYQAVARPFRIVFAILPFLIFLLSFFLRFAFVRRGLNKQAMEHGERMPAEECRIALRGMRDTKMMPALLDRMEIEGPFRPMTERPMPVHIAWCAHDRVIPFEAYGRPMLKAVAGSVPRIVRNAGHVPMYDEPEQVAGLILETIASAEARNGEHRDGAAVAA